MSARAATSGSGGLEGTGDDSPTALGEAELLTFIPTHTAETVAARCGVRVSRAEFRARIAHQKTPDEPPRGLTYRFRRKCVFPRETAALRPVLIAPKAANAA